MELKCVVKNYAWGKLAPDGEVARLARPGSFSVGQPCSELWIGTHTNGPSILSETGQLLSDFIRSSPEALLGSASVECFGPNLPFLFKVLSIKRALSIQTHPDKQTAVRLNALQPDVYKDANYKPELAIALTPFEALCGFRPLDEIEKFVSQVPELSVALGQISGDVSSIEVLFTALMRTDIQIISQQLDLLVKRLKGTATSNSKEEELLLKIYQDFPSDRGCFAVFFFNYVALLPGQSLFVAPNTPHAYISGDCIECMASSDNVVRAGLTPKLIDIETLLNILDYNPTFYKTNDESRTSYYRIPFEFKEFSIRRYASVETIEKLSVASVLLFIRGNGVLVWLSENSRIEFRSGSVFFIPANSQMYIEQDDDEGSYEAFQAFAAL